MIDNSISSYWGNIRWYYMISADGFVWQSDDRKRGENAYTTGDDPAEDMAPAYK